MKVKHILKLKELKQLYKLSIIECHIDYLEMHQWNDLAFHVVPSKFWLYVNIIAEAQFVLKERSKQHKAILWLIKQRNNLYLKILNMYNKIDGRGL